MVLKNSITCSAKAVEVRAEWENIINSLLNKERQKQNYEAMEPSKKRFNVNYYKKKKSKEYCNKLKLQKKGSKQYRTINSAKSLDL